MSAGAFSWIQLLAVVVRIRQRRKDMVSCVLQESRVGVLVLDRCRCELECVGDEHLVASGIVCAQGAQRRAVGVTDFDDLLA